MVMLADPFPTTPESQLLRRILNGTASTEEKVEFQSKYEHAICVTVRRRLLGTQMYSEDNVNHVTHNVLTQVFATKCNGYEHKAKFRNFMSRVCRWQVYKFVRDETRRQEREKKAAEAQQAAMLSQSNPVPELETKEDLEFLARAWREMLKYLKPNHQQVLNLLFGEEGKLPPQFSYPEVSQKTGESLSNIKKIVRKARMKVREILLRMRRDSGDQ